VFDQAASRGLGLSSFVSAGNKSDISSNDLIQFWEADEDTSLILLYVESFGNPRRFARIARRVGRSKPIVAVKSGRSAAGARGAASHTGALLASDVTVDALFRQAGVIRTDTLAELFDVASLLAAQPPPAGRRVGIVTNAGGLGILCADACEAGGLDVAELPARLRRELASDLPSGASAANPVDMLATAGAGDYERTVAKLCSSRSVDAVIALFIPPLETRPEEVARAIRAAASGAKRRVPVLAVIMGGGAGVATELADGGIRIPAFEFPEEAARALALGARYGEWRRAPEEPPPLLPGIREDEAAAVLASALGEEPSWLPPDKVAALLGCYGLPLVETRFAASPTAAGRIARDLAGPVALKGVARDLVHKSDVGAVRVGLLGASQTSAAAAAMAAGVAEAGHRLEGFLVQPMAPPGVEMLVGVTHDRLFGPVVACAAGGVAVELIKDVSVRLAPLTEGEAADMVRSLATYPLLDGYRGAPKADRRALEDVLLRVSALADAHPEIAELDLNPVVVGSEGAAIVDARVLIQPVAPRRPSPSLEA
jgi:acyl-CoA synthetase (NDP forming)